MFDSNQRLMTLFCTTNEPPSERDEEGDGRMYEIERRAQAAMRIAVCAKLAACAVFQPNMSDDEACNQAYLAACEIAVAAEEAATKAAGYESWPALKAAFEPLLKEEGLWPLDGMQKPPGEYH